MNIPTKYQANPFNNAIEILNGGDAFSAENYCSARQLHEALGVGRDFSNWFRDRVKQYGFELDEDYITISLVDTSSYSPDLANRNNSHKGKSKIDYKITLDMAKELAMIENNEIGRRVRRYFIQAEKAARAMLIEQANQVQPIEQVTKRIKDNGKFKYLIILHEQGHKIAKAMANETDPEAKYQLHCQLRQVNGALGIPTLPLNDTRKPEALENSLD
jgi:phage anti-repressor protein